MDEIQKFTVEIENIRFTYYVKGRGKPLFLVPAFHSDINRFMVLIDFLADYFTVYIPELPGIGISQPLGHHAHTAVNYAHFLNLMIKKLDLRNYVLAGFCLGTVIATRMLQQGITLPDHLIYFEALYDASLITIPQRYMWVIKLINKLGPNNKILKLLARHTLHNKKFLNFYFRLVYRHERNIDTVVNHQIRLTIEMNTRAWLELLYDIFHLHLGRDNLEFKIPTLLVFNIYDNILDIPNTIKGIKKIFPNSTLVTTNLTIHSPVGPIDKKFMEKIITPILPHLIKIARN